MIKNRLSISEMLQKVSEAPKDKRVELFREYANQRTTLLGALQLALDPRVQFAFTPGWEPEYKPCEFLDQWARLHQEMRKMSKFLVGGDYPNITEEKRRLLFIQLLEALDPSDAEFMVLAKDKKLPYKITRKLVDEAFPGLIAEATAA